MANSIKDKGLKEPVALIVSFLVIYIYQFDAMAIIFSKEKNSFVGYLLTAGIIAGGSKGSIKLFREFLGWKSAAQDEYEKSKKQSDEEKKKKEGQSE